MITKNYMTISPAYGKDYKNQKEAIAAFKDGKDFEMQSIASGFAGSYCSKTDFSPGVTVNIRFKQMRNIAVVKV